MFPILVRMMRPSGATELPLTTFLSVALLFEIEGHRPSSAMGVDSGVRCPLVSDGVRDKFTRGLDAVVVDKLISLILVGKESGFGGRFVDIERVREEVVVKLFGCSSFDLSLDLARSRVVRFGATDFDGRVFDRLTDGGRDLERVLDVDSFDFLGDLFDASFNATFFLAAQFALRIVVGPPVTDDDSLPPSLA